MIAIVCQHEIGPELKHCFVLEELIQFLARTDPERGSVGLLNM